MLEYALRQERLKYQQLLEKLNSSSDDKKIIEATIQSTPTVNITNGDDKKIQLPPKVPKILTGELTGTTLLRKYLADLNASDAWLLLSKTSDIPSQTMNQFGKSVIHESEPTKNIQTTIHEQEETPRIEVSQPKSEQPPQQESNESIDQQAIKKDEEPISDTKKEEVQEQKPDEEQPKKDEETVFNEEQQQANEEDDEEIEKKMSLELSKKFKISRRDLDNMMRKAGKFHKEYSLQFPKKKKPEAEKKVVSFDGSELSELSGFKLDNIEKV